MRVMILDEVDRFRRSVRAPPQQQGYGQQQQAQAGQQQVPIPEGGFQGQRYEDPRPQEMAARMQGADLERELQGGLDAMRG